MQTTQFAVAMLVSLGGLNSVAVAQETAVQAPVGAPQIVSGFQAENSNLLNEMGKRFQLSYWSMFTGPSFQHGFGTGDTIDATGEVAPLEVFHQLITGYEVAEDNIVGIQWEFTQQFGARSLETPHTFVVENPKAFWNQLNVVDNSFLNLQLQWMVEGIVSEEWKATTAQVGFQANQVWQFKTPNPDWYVSLNTSLGTYLYEQKDSNPLLTVVVSPWVTYALSDSLKILAWASLDEELMHGEEKNHWNPWESNFVRLGPLFSISEQFQIYPCVQMYVDSPSWENTTLGFELSASL